MIEMDIKVNLGSFSIPGGHGDHPAEAQVPTDSTAKGNVGISEQRALGLLRKTPQKGGSKTFCYTHASLGRGVA